MQRVPSELDIGKPFNMHQAMSMFVHALINVFINTKLLSQSKNPSLIVSYTYLFQVQAIANQLIVHNSYSIFIPLFSLLQMDTLSI